MAAASSTTTSTAPATDERVALSATRTEYDPRRIAVTVDRRAEPRLTQGNHVRTAEIGVVAPIASTARRVASR